MIPAFLEAVRATTQPCTLLLLLPPLVMAVLTRGRWTPFAAIGIGAVLGGWLFAANVVALSDTQVQVSGLFVAATIGAVVAAPRVKRLHWGATPAAQTVTAGAVAFIAALWWRPCVGQELGAILTASRRGLLGQLPGMTAYMLGAMVPVLAVVLMIRVIEPSPIATRRAAVAASAAGVIVAGAMALGRHDELVVTLTRWTT